MAKPSEGWASAASYQGGIQLHTGMRNSAYDRRALRKFRLALENGDIFVQVEGRTVRPEFWRQDWSFEVRSERLLSAFKNFVRTVEGVAPYLVVPQAPERLDTPAPVMSSSGTARSSGVASPADKPGPKPGVSGKVRTLELRDAILADARKRPAFKHGWKAELARLIQEQLQVEGHNYQFGSVTKTLRAHKTAYPKPDRKRIASG